MRSSKLTFVRFSVDFYSFNINFNDIKLLRAPDLFQLLVDLTFLYTVCESSQKISLLLHSC
jgi:hypothetical protein